MVQAQIAKRQTAAVYLQTLVTHGLLQMQGNGREKLYLNHRLIDLLIDLLKNEAAGGDVA